MHFQSAIALYSWIVADWEISRVQITWDRPAPKLMALNALSLGRRLVTALRNKGLMLD